MSTGSVSPALDSLDRLASRASGHVAFDAVMPRRPSVFEPAPGAATHLEESNEEQDARSNRASPVTANDTAVALQPSVRATTPIRREPDYLQAGVMRAGLAPQSAQDPASAVRQTAVDPMAFPAPYRDTREPRQTTHVESRIIDVTPRAAERVSEKARIRVAQAEAPPRPIAARESSMPAATTAVPPAQQATIVHQHISTIPPSRRPAGLLAERGAVNDHVVHVTIGRVEIRATSLSATRPPKEPVRAVRNESGLDSYLRRRGLGSRS